MHHRWIGRKRSNQVRAGFTQQRSVCTGAVDVHDDRARSDESDEDHSIRIRVRYVTVDRPGRGIKLRSGAAFAGFVTLWPVFDCSCPLDDVSVHVTVTVRVPGCRRPLLYMGLNHDGGLGLEHGHSNDTGRPLGSRYILRRDHFDGHVAPSELIRRALGMFVLRVSRITRGTLSTV